MTLYGFGIGQSGDVVVNFTSNPKPRFVTWRLDDDTAIPVEPFSPGAASTRYEVGPLRAVEVIKSHALLLCRHSLQLLK